MDDFQKRLRQLRGSRAFAAAFDKKRAEAEVAFQIRRLRESKGWSQKDLAKKVRCSQRGGLGGRTAGLQAPIAAAPAPYCARPRRGRCRRARAKKSCVIQLCSLRGKIAADT